MIIESELREEIARAVSGDVSLDALYSWLMGRSWNMHRNSEPAAVDLAGEVEQLFFERSDGYRNDASVLNELSSLLNNVVMNAAIIENEKFAPHVQCQEASQSVHEQRNDYASQAGYQSRFVKIQAHQLHSRLQPPWSLKYA